MSATLFAISQPNAGGAPRTPVTDMTTEALVAELRAMRGVLHDTTDDASDPDAAMRRFQATRRHDDVVEEILRRQQPRKTRA